MMIKLSRTFLFSSAFSFLSNLFFFYGSELTAASHSEEITKIDSFLEKYQPHQVYFQNQSDLDVEMSLFFKNEIVPADNDVITWDPSFPSSQAQRIIGKTRGNEVRIRNYGSQSFYYPSSKKINISADSTLKYSAPDYAFMTGIIGEYDGSVNIFRSGNNWVVSFSKGTSLPFDEKEIIRPYFSLAYYNATYSFDFSLDEALSHYLTQSVKEGYNPNEWFNTEKYQRYFETEINPFVDFLLQRSVCLSREDRILAVNQNTTLDDAIYTLLYQLRYKVLPQQLILKTEEPIAPSLAAALVEKGFLINPDSSLQTETIPGDFIEDRMPWFKKYRAIQARDFIGKTFTFGAFEHNESGAFLQCFTQFTLAEDGRIDPSPHENEVRYRFTEDNHLEILNYKDDVTSLFVVKKQSNAGYYGFLGKFMDARQRHHFLCTTDDLEQIRGLFSDFMVDTHSRFEIFHTPGYVSCDYSYDNPFEEQVRRFFPHSEDSLKHNHNQMLKKSEAIITQGKKLPVEERIEKISHHLWLTNAERPSYPSSALVELCTDEMGRMDLKNNFLHWIWTNVELPGLERELYLRGISFSRKAPDEAFDNPNIKQVCDRLVETKLFGIAVNPLKYAILKKFGGSVLDMGVVLKPNNYELLSQFSFIGYNVPEWKWGVDIYCLSAKSHHPIYEKMVDLDSNLDSLSTDQRSLILHSPLGDVCWMGMITYFLDAFKQSDTTLLAEFGSCAWTQRSRTWINGTSGNNPIKVQPLHQLEGKTQLPIFSHTIEELEEDLCENLL